MKPRHQTLAKGLIKMDKNIGTVWKHVKSGTDYLIAGECRLEATGEPAYLYKRMDGIILWARDKEEFLDGRFEKLPDVPNTSENGDT